MQYNFVYNFLRKVTLPLFVRKPHVSFEEFEKFLSNFDRNLFYFKMGREWKAICWWILSGQFNFLDNRLTWHIEDLYKNKKLDKNSNFLSLGAGPGVNFKILQDRGLLSTEKYWALDIDFEIKPERVLSSHTLIANICKPNITEKLGFREYFNFVYAIGLLQHINNKNLYVVLDNIVSFVKKGGFLFVDGYVLQGKTYIPNIGKMENVELGSIWISGYDKFKAYYKYLDHKICVFLLPIGYISRSQILRKFNLLSIICSKVEQRDKSWDEIIISFWKQMCVLTGGISHFNYFWYPMELLCDYLKNRELHIIKAEKCLRTPKYYILAYKPKANS